MFTFYAEPEIISISPTEGKTSETNEITLIASLEKPFSTRKKNKKKKKNKFIY